MFARALVLVAVLVGVMATPASASLRPVDEGGDYEHCVTFDEFGLVHSGMPMNRVQRIFDTNGHRVHRDRLDDLANVLGQVYGDVARGTTVRQYPTCTDDPETAGQAFVEFAHARGKWRVRLGILTG